MHFEALIEIRQIGTPEFYTEFFGTSFVSFFSRFGFEKILRVAGRYYRDFLYSIDQLHDSNRFTFPHMKSPTFYVEGEDDNGVFLHYKYLLLFTFLIIINFYSIKNKKKRLCKLCYWTIG